MSAPEMIAACQYCNQRHGKNDGCVRSRHAIANNECGSCHQRGGLHDPECKITTCPTCSRSFVPVSEPLCTHCACYVPDAFTALIRDALQGTQSTMLKRAYARAPADDPELAEAQKAETWIKETIKEITRRLTV